MDPVHGLWRKDLNLETTPFQGSMRLCRKQGASLLLCLVLLVILPRRRLSRPSSIFTDSWRRPKGIDSRVRRKFKGVTLMPNNKLTRLRSQEDE